MVFIGRVKCGCVLVIWVGQIWVTKFVLHKYGKFGSDNFLPNPTHPFDRPNPLSWSKSHTEQAANTIRKNQTRA